MRPILALVIAIALISFVVALAAGFAIIVNG
ncbi:MAG: hypothetical protein HLUCCA04_06470 [Oceanicaulis sp. HLUCCA04]|nr:MAG: hypothetical protein HLUCCA04_06470 [Oceanicaulis sp. HLUCCA04]